MNNPAKMNEQAQRIIQIMQDKNMNPTRFAEVIGIQRAAMSHIKLGRNNPSADVLTKIIERFDDINPGWLLTGKGSMKLVSDHPNGVIDFNTANQTHENNSQIRGTVNQTEKKDIQRQKTVKPSAETVNQPDNDRKVIEKEVVVYKDRPEKNVDKIVVFFSDHTYDTFVTENSERK